jgi:inhibitor of KinA
VVIEPFGDSAVLVTLGHRIDEALSLRAHAIARTVRHDPRPGWGTPVPGFASVLVPFDATLLTPDEAVSRIADLVAASEGSTSVASTAQPAITIPVRYGGGGGPDLGWVAESTGLSQDRVIELHSSVTYLVHLLGFAPGFAYLGTLPEALTLPRRAEPRTSVPAGSVAIAARQTAIYPFTTPGGWHLIGRSTMPLWDLDADPPARLRPGMRVRFRPVPTQAGDPDARGG